MSFTPKIIVGSLFAGVLTMMSFGWIATPPTHSAAPPRTVTTLNAAPAAFAYEVTPAVWYKASESSYYQPVTAWYKNKHWWKRNAPIIGGAGGGALVGGLLGGGKGALIGGAVGGGGGYAYKRLKHHHEHHEYRHDYQKGHNTNYQHQ